MKRHAARKFVCNFGSCGKSFTRAEHLQRHELNHRESENTCQRCRAHFARPDLLERHMERHAQKDREAGGEGLGILVTRKRCWRDEDGRITTKRPASSAAALARTIERRSSASSSNRSSSISESDYMHTLPPQQQSTGADHIMSPPYSSQDSTGESVRRLSRSSEVGMASSPSPEKQDYAALKDGALFLPPQPSAEDILAACQADFDELFTADTASSFNMPFTTLSNYNWLFDEPRVSAPTEQLLGPEVQTDDIIPGINYDNPALTTSGEEYLPFGTSDTAQRKQPQSAEDSVEARLYECLPRVTRQRTNGLDASCRESTPETTAVTAEPIDIGEISPKDTRGLRQHTSKEAYAHLVSPTQTYQSLMPTGSATTMTLPQIDEIARAQVITLITHATSGTSFPISAGDPLLSLAALQNYCDLFFTRFNNPAYPLIHRETFDPSTVPTMLLTSVLMLGATYGDKDAHHMAVRVHDVLRGVLISSDYFNASPELWVLQTVLLIEVFGKARAGIKQHDMAHLFHGLLINLIRRSDCQTSSPPVERSSMSGDLDRDWKVWIHAEEKKRLAIMAFMWDVQHALLFSQSLCMSAFELRLPLPSSPEMWEASSAESWYKAWSTERQPPHFLPVLKLFLNPSKRHPPPDLNAFSRLLILHGLMSIQWDMRRRDQTSLGFAPENGGSLVWKDRLRQAYDAWKDDFDSYCASSKDKDPDFQKYKTSTVALYHASHIILTTDILDLQIYAGARNILGKSVMRGDYDRSRQAVRSWVQSDGAAKAVWHAASMIQDGNAQLEDWVVDGRFMYPWCLYLATLTAWSFCFALGGGRQEEERIESDLVWDAREECVKFVDAMCDIAKDKVDERVEFVTTGKARTAGMIATVATHLGTVRWALVHEGMKVLRGLIAGRLIRGFDVGAQT